MIDTAELASEIARRYPHDPDAQQLAAELCGDERDLDQRDALLFEAWRRFFPNVGPATAAEKIRAGLLRYAGGADWPVDRMQGNPPTDPRRAMWWRILKADAGRILSERQIRKILALRTSKGQRPESS